MGKRKIIFNTIHHPSHEYFGYYWLSACPIDWSIDILIDWLINWLLYFVTAFFVLLCLFQINDWPDLKFRGVLWDVSSGRIPTLVSEYALVEWMADWVHRSYV